MAERPIALPKPLSYAARLKQIQEEMKTITDLASESLQIQMARLATECDVAQTYPVKVGEREVYRQVAEQMRAALDRLAAIGNRK